MKEILVCCIATIFSACGYAQNYVGATFGVSKYASLNCTDSTGCDNKGRAVKFFAGSKFSPSTGFGFGSFSIDAIEVGYINFGNALGGSTSVYTVYDADLDAYVGVIRPVSEKVEANAMTAAMVGRLPIGAGFSLAGRLGLAYVSTSVSRSVGTATDGSTQVNRVKPYFGLGVEYSMGKIMTIAGGVDLTQYDTGVTKGTLSTFGLGVQTEF